MSNSQKMDVLCDINGIPTGGLAFADTTLNFTTTLLATVAQTLTVPANCNRAVFSFTPLGTFVSDGVSAITLPGGAFASGPQELNPIDRRVKAGDTLNFIANVTTYVQVRFLTDSNIYG